MSQLLINRSPDLKQLRDEGYSIKVREGYLFVENIPYVTPQREIKRGTIITKLILAGDRTAKPEWHVAYFVGEYPCNADGSPIEKIRNSSPHHELAPGVFVDHMFSAKPIAPKNGYDNYYEKVMPYVAAIAGQAQAINHAVKPNEFLPIEDCLDDPVFNYFDSASSRAEIGAVTQRLAIDNVAIIGLGGTGAYILDFVAKTPVKRIHIFDGDTFYQHNAFRAPGAPSLEDLQAQPKKTSYLRNIYSRMHRGIIEHDFYIAAESIEQLNCMNIVFLCLDHGEIKRTIIAYLLQRDIPFIDVGMGLYMNEDDKSLAGQLRVTTVTSQKSDHIKNRIPLSDNMAPNEYSTNIQIADLNALNAVLAVIRWKKMFGFYSNIEKEHNCTYILDGNRLLNEDKMSYGAPEKN